MISRDEKQRRKNVEHAALRQHGVTVLYIKQSGKAAEIFKDAARIIANWPKIAEWAATAKPGVLAKLDTQDRIVSFKD